MTGTATELPPLLTVADFLIVDSTRVAAELSTRDTQGSWPANPEEIGPGGVIGLTAIGHDLPTGEVHVGTHLG